MSTKRSWKLQEFVAHGGNVNCLSLGPKSGRVMVTGGDDRKVNMWAVGKPNCIMSLAGHNSPVECVRFSSSEELVAAGSQSGSLKIWDLEAAKIVRTLTGHKSNMRCLDFHPYGDFVASGSLDTNIKLWDVRRKGCIYTYTGHKDAVNCLRFSPDGKWIISAGEDGLIKLWDLTTGKMLQEFKHHRGPVTHVEFHPNEFLFASGSNDKTVKYWDLETFELVSSTAPGSSAVRCIEFHPDGNYLFSGTQDMMHVFGWEPVRCYDTFAMGWGKVADMAVANTQLIGAAFNQTNVSVHVVDLTRINKAGTVQEGASDLSNEELNKPPSPAKNPLSASGRKNFITDRPHTTSTKQRKEPEVKTQPRQSPTQDEPEEDNTPADIQDPSKYKEIFHPTKRLSHSPTRQEDPFPAPPDDEPAAAPVPRAAPPATAVSYHQPPPLAQPREMPAPAPTAAVPPTSRRSRSPPALNQKKVAEPKMVAKEQTMIIPSDRNEPAGLDMNAFLPPNMQGAREEAPSKRKQSESEVMESIQKGNTSMCAVLSSRRQNLDVIRAIWTAGDVKTALESAINMKDQAIVVDLLNILCLKRALWNLDLCVITLPKIKELITSKYENYVQTACTSLKLILKSFTGLINNNIRTPYQGVDISREERYNKCSKCYTYLLAMRGMVEERQHISGKMGSTFRELQLLLVQLE
ncbi:katanin p80 WD40 repeat-containing subunit B1-like [Amphiura filiformis]|uniref:katanin p80 WD40 repeat-containing subunit B1-like n=1 Tax=Amphiura filiformis TaxID=82378 RepID=UPI003B20F199